MKFKTIMRFVVAILSFVLMAVSWVVFGLMFQLYRLYEMFLLVVLMVTIPVVMFIWTIVGIKKKRNRPPGALYGFTIISGIFWLCYATAVYGTNPKLESNKTLALTFSGVGIALLVISLFPGKKSKRSYYKGYDNSAEDEYYRYSKRVDSEEEMTKQRAYEILNVSAEMSPEEIKGVYKRLTHIYHPDTSKDPKAHKHFIKIQKAYEYLTDNVFRSND